MSEVQHILLWLHNDIHLSDNEVAELCGVRRETINRLRLGKVKGETGKTILPILRKLAIKGDMPDSQIPDSQRQQEMSAPAKTAQPQSKKSAPAILPTSQPIASKPVSLPRASMPIAQSTKTPPPSFTPRQQKPSQHVVTTKQYGLYTFREYEDFMCVKCHTHQIARRDTGYKCTNCGHPYHLRINAFLEEKMLQQKKQERIRIRRL